MAEGLPGTDFLNGSANYKGVVGDLTYVGSYTAKPSDSAYGTFDQHGNVMEWNEAVFGSSRCVRGWSFKYTDPTVLAFDPSAEHVDVGFRVAGASALDDDRDVDLEDFALFQAAFTGPQ